MDNPYSLEATLERLNWHYGRGDIVSVSRTSFCHDTGKLTGGSARVVCPKLNSEGDLVRYRVTYDARGKARVRFRGHTRRVEI